MRVVTGRLQSEKGFIISRLIKYSECSIAHVNMLLSILLKIHITKWVNPPELMQKYNNKTSVSSS